MNKRNLIIAAIIFVLLVAIGIGEIVLINKNFGTFRNKLAANGQMAAAGSLTLGEFDQTWDFWKSKRTFFDFCLTHHETIEVEMRLAECYAYLENGDYDGLNVQLKVLIELSEHIPHKCFPRIEHLL